MFVSFGSSCKRVQFEMGKCRSVMDDSAGVFDFNIVLSDGRNKPACFLFALLDRRYITDGNDNRDRLAFYGKEDRS